MVQFIYGWWLRFSPYLKNMLLKMGILPQVEVKIKNHLKPNLFWIIYFRYISFPDKFWRPTNRPWKEEPQLVTLGTMPEPIALAKCSRLCTETSGFELIPSHESLKQPRKTSKSQMKVSIFYFQVQHVRLHTPKPC